MEKTTSFLENFSFISIRPDRLHPIHGHLEFLHLLNIFLSPRHPFFHYGGHASQFPESHHLDRHFVKLPSTIALPFILLSPTMDDLSPPNSVTKSRKRNRAEKTASDKFLFVPLQISSPYPSINQFTAAKRTFLFI